MNSESSDETEGSVVVPAIDTASSVVCLRSLGQRGIETIAIAENRDAPALRSKYCDRAIEVPSPDEDLLGYKEALVALASRPGVRTIVPLREADTYVLAKYREEFAEYIPTPWPSLEVLRNAQDRVRLFEAAERAGVPIPETRLLDTIENWDRDRIVKARYALLASAYIDELTEHESQKGALTRHLDPGVEPDVEAMTAEMGHVPITQEFVPGSEYAVWALCNEGEPIAICQRRRVRGFKYTGGASVCRQTMYDPELDSIGRALIDELDWHGPASIQFIKDDATGEYKLMEVNPRFWASISCAIAAGLDFPHLYWRFAGGDPVRPEPTYERGVATHLLRGEAVYLLSVLREHSPYVERPSFAGELREVLASIYEQPRFDYLSLDDPRPFVRDLRNVAAELV
ncbi:carboxylate--amine ligase [Halobacteriales archaeon QS_3_64_16]|nr:MAG: carboxylate--amine ligase [Halobacteriales archaeon QS_3_64_16]